MKKILTILQAMFIIVVAAISSGKVVNVNGKVLEKEFFKVAVLLSDYDDPYIAAIQKSLEEIQREDKYTFQYSFYNGQKSQDIQNEQLHNVIKKNDADIILLNLVNQENSKYAVDRIKERNIPVILFGGIDIDVVKSYNKAYWLGRDVIEGAILQGEIVIKLWNESKVRVDKNNDNIIQYVMLQGTVNDKYAIKRTKHSILTINNAGIETQEIERRVCNWSEEEAKAATNSLLLRFGNRIEVIIANNDTMAIGAIKALQEHGYNNGDKGREVHVIGFDGIKEAQYLIKNGVMSGTVIQDPHDSARALHEISINLIHNRDITYGTEYKHDVTRDSIILPHKGIVTKLDVNSNF